MERIIHIKSLAVQGRLGVPEEERATPQHLLCDLRFAARLQPEDLHDDLSNTVNYATISERVQELIEEQPRQLLESLVDRITKVLLEEFQLRWIELTIRKFILPNTEYVAVTLRREEME